MPTAATAYPPWHPKYVDDPDPELALGAPEPDDPVPKKRGPKPRPEPAPPDEAALRADARAHMATTPLGRYLLDRMAGIGQPPLGAPPRPAPGPVARAPRPPRPAAPPTARTVLQLRARAVAEQLARGGARLARLLAAPPPTGPLAAQVAALKLAHLRARLERLAAEAPTLAARLAALPPAIAPGKYPRPTKPAPTP